MSRADMSSVSHPAWPFPFADEREGSLSRRQWLMASVGLLALHFVSLLVAFKTGNFDPDPNHDHVRTMRQILDDGFPTIAVWPPAFGYYLAFKWKLAQVLGIPYAAGKFLIDPLPVVLSGLLTVRLAHLLTRSRFLALTASFIMAVSPLFAMASAEGLALIIFQPLFIGALILLVRELRRPDGPGLPGMAVAGLVTGLSCLVRGNPQFLIFALLPLIGWVIRGTGERRWVVRTAAVVAVFLVGEILAIAPWSLMQRKAGKDGLFTAPVVYFAFFDGMKRHRGFRISDELRSEGRPQRSMDSVVAFNLRWLREDPGALMKIYLVKFVRAWYLSDSGRWDNAIILTHAPIWFLALTGLVLWWRRKPPDGVRDAAWFFIVLVVIYMWFVSAVLSGLARYSIPLYSLIGLLAGIPIVVFRRRGEG